MRAAAAVLAGLLLAGCTGSPPPPASYRLAAQGPAEGPPIWLVRRGGHVQVVLPRRAYTASGAVLPEAVGAGGWIAAGWGDAGYYPADAPGSGAALRAGLWPSRAVLKLRAVAHPRDMRGPAWRLPAGPAQRRRAARAIAASRSPREAALPPGFYPAKGRYHLANTCNQFSARVLAAAGCRAGPPRLRVTAGRVLALAESCGARAGLGPGRRPAHIEGQRATGPATTSSQR